MSCVNRVSSLSGYQPRVLSRHRCDLESVRRKSRDHSRPEMMRGRLQSVNSARGMFSMARACCRGPRSLGW